MEERENLASKHRYQFCCGVMCHIWGGGGTNMTRYFTVYFFDCFSNQGLKIGLVAAKKLVVFPIWLAVGLNWASSHKV